MSVPTSVRADRYVPGHTKRKVLMMLLGMAITGYGLSQLGPPLSLVLTGRHALAQATQVIKTKPGLPEQSFSNDHNLIAAEETRDRSYIFWNELRYATPDGADHVVRLKIGSQLKPIFPLLDSDGLPTSVEIFFDPKNPTRVCVPILLSNWFGPGLITFMGVVCTAFGALIVRQSRRGIET